MIIAKTRDGRKEIYDIDYKNNDIYNEYFSPSDSFYLNCRLYRNYVEVDLEYDLDILEVLYKYMYNIFEKFYIYKNDNKYIIRVYSYIHYINDNINSLALEAINTLKDILDIINIFIHNNKVR